MHKKLNFLVLLYYFICGLYYSVNWVVICGQRLINKRNKLNLSASKIKTTVLEISLMFRLYFLIKINLIRLLKGIRYCITEVENIPL